MRTLSRKRKKAMQGRRKAAWEWTLTNIGAVISIMGLMLAIMVFFQYLFVGMIFLILMVVAMAMVIFGYGLIVKDYIDKKRKPDRKGAHGKKGPEEE